MARARHDDTRGLWRGLERTSRPEDAGHRCGPPWIKLPINPHETLRIALLPTPRVGIEHLGCLSPVRAVRVGSLLREEQPTLALPILCVRETREDRLATQRRSAADMVVSDEPLRPSRQSRRMGKRIPTSANRRTDRCRSSRPMCGKRCSTRSDL